MPWGAARETFHNAPPKVADSTVRRLAIQLRFLEEFAEQGAQQLADRLVGAGISAIPNFAPIQLQVPAAVEVKNVNLAVERETLSYALQYREEN
ncbi:MAG: hypothetical protein ABIR59_12175 [Gemmatimonadales bacterium]